MKRTIDIDALLTPIPGENPAGEDLRYTPVYDDIKEARRADDAFSMGEWQREIKSSDWEKVISISLAALEERTKDLQIAAWLAEALVATDGFNGLAAGIRIMAGHVVHFWDTVYPKMEGDDLDYRVAPFEFFNDKLCSSVKLVPLTEPDVTPAYSLIKWQESREVGYDADTRNKYGDIDEQKQKRRSELLDEGKIPAEEFDASVIKSSASFYQSLAENLSQCRETFKALDKAADEKFGGDAPRLSDLGEALNECDRLVSRILREQKGQLVDQEPPPATAPDTASEQEPPPTVQSPAAASGNTTVSEPVLPPLDQLPVPQVSSDVVSREETLWSEALMMMENGGFKDALDRLLSISNSQPSERGRNRYRFLVAKLCMKAGRPGLARPIIEQLNTQIVELQLERWESPVWIAEVLDALYQCLISGEPPDEDITRANELFKRICTMDVTKALVYRK